jgi:phosphoribosyl 1,2-cyclic phosphodiesterase
MKIKVWGCRGTLPTPGPHTNDHGGNTTCLEIRNENNDLTIVDAGSGLRLLGKELVKEEGLKSMCLILTHSHWDHLMGFPFFLPAYFSKYTIHVCGVVSAKDYMKQSLARQLEAPYFPVNFEDLKANFDFSCSRPGCSKCINIKIEPIALSHPNGGFGYKFTNKAGKVFVFLTDNELGYRHETGLTFEEYVEFCKDADLLFHDAQYTDKEYEKTKAWGHSTYNQALQLAIDANVKQFGIFHHDPDRTDQQLDQIVTDLKKQIERQGTNLEVFAVKDFQEFNL